MRYFGKAEGQAGTARAAKQKPGHEPGLPLTVTLWNAASNLRDLTERLVHAALDRLGGLGGDLLGQRAEFLALRRERLELLARVGTRRLDPFRERLRSDQLAVEI